MNLALEQRRPLRDLAVRGLEEALQLSGLSAAYVAKRRSFGATILMYHSIISHSHAAFLDPGCALSVSAFGAHMAFLAQHRNVVSVAELCESIERKRALPRGSVVITFDDGYLDTYSVAAPILASYGFPATVYLATGYVDTGENQWVDRLYTALRWRTQAHLSLDGMLEQPRLDSPHRLRSAYRSLCQHLLSATWSERQSLLERIEAELSPERSAPRLTMTWEEVRTLIQRYPKWELGVHTRTHLDLSKHPAHAADELEQSFNDVKTHTGVAARHFSFPYGRNLPSLRSRLLALGFHTAVRTDPAGLVGPDSDPFELPRTEAPRRVSRLRYCTSGAYPDLSLALCGRAALP